MVARKRNITRRKAKTVRRPRVRASGMDVGALNYRKLLLDPCNANLVGPAYEGAHSGNYRRLRRIITIPSAEVEAVYQFQLGSNNLMRGGHSAGNSGQNITFTTEKLWTLESDQEIRCIAGCVKVRFIGAESARAGTVGLSTGQPMGDRAWSAATFLTLCPVINRVGEVNHEVRFVPYTPDQLFAATGAAFNAAQSTLNVCFTGLPAGTLQLEVTAVYEFDYLVGGVISSVPPASSNTLSQVLRSLGSVSQWAFGHVVVPTLKAAKHAAMQTLASSAAAAAEHMAVLAL